MLSVLAIARDLVLEDPLAGKFDPHVIVNGTRPLYRLAQFAKWKETQGTDEATTFVCPAK